MVYIYIYTYKRAPGPGLRGGPVASHGVGTGPRGGPGAARDASGRVLGALHASWQPTGAVPSRFRPHFGGLPTSKSMLPCRRELDFQESCFFGAEFEKGLQKRPRSTSKRS